MCGIAGLVRTDDFPIDRAAAAVNAMVRRLAHRGPDGHGVAVSPGAHAARGPAAVFGHTRLAIIDLSERGAQPMRTAAGDVMVTFNGEIYNFAELRTALEAEGRTFRSNSDTEVVLQGYEAWGSAVIERLRGMFALAIWDDTRQRLLCARDRLGIKPLYMYRGQGWVAFASEVRALLASGLVPATLDAVAVDAFLTHQTVPTPRTLVAGVTMLEPGHVMTVESDGRVVSRAYWDALSAGTPIDPDAAMPAIRTRVHELLLESTALHLVSDVPVGVFLSGGIDSSAVVALVRQTGVVPHTFGIAFPGTSFDESAYARAAADALGAEHVEIPLGEHDFLDALPEALDSFDHPSGDGINTFVVSRAVRRAGIKVALSGLGGDELFGGYPSFARMRQLRRYAGILARTPSPVRAAAAGLLRLGGAGTIAAEKTAALVETDGQLSQAFPLLRQMFLEEQREGLLGTDVVERAKRAGNPYVEMLDGALQQHGQRDLMALVSYAETRTYMHDVLLRDTDQMSMQHGLEVRVPLLDHELVSYVMRAPDAAKLASPVPKSLLIDSLGVDLPPACVNRPKQGFVLPFDPWMRGALKSFCERHLRQLGQRPLFRARAVDALWTEFLSGSRRTSWSRPWTLVALDAWMERNGVA